jgi:hypothetical protein
MTKNEIDKNYIERLQNYAESTKKAIDYSIERFDILIITLSSSGLVLSIGFVKDIIKDFSKINPSLLKITWLLFAGALIMNLISQVTGYFAHKTDLANTENAISIEKGKKNNFNIKGMELRQSILNSCTLTLNGGSLISLITGIITLIIFISKYV